MFNVKFQFWTQYKTSMDLYYPIAFETIKEVIEYFPGTEKRKQTNQIKRGAPGKTSCQ